MTRSACRASALPLVLFVANTDLISIAPSKCHDECFKSIGAKNVLSMGDASFTLQEFLDTSSWTIVGPGTVAKCNYDKVVFAPTNEIQVGIVSREGVSKT